jgi:hypothetical protein
MKKTAMKTICTLTMRNPILLRAFFRRRPFFCAKHRPLLLTGVWLACFFRKKLCFIFAIELTMP